MSERALIIYSTAALFNARETFHNIHLARLLEETGRLRCFLPQRDGFEFAALDETFQRVLQREEFQRASFDSESVSRAVQLIIYLLDLGLAIGNSDLVLANIDEPVDEGVVVEICFARNLGKPVICWRSDVRSPFGTASSRFSGAHFFPPLSGDFFIHQPCKAETAEDADRELGQLAAQVVQVLAHPKFTALCAAPAPTLNGWAANIKEATVLVFGDGSPFGVREKICDIVARFLQTQESVEALVLPHSASHLTGSKFGL